jgi:hypothetical protein
MCYKELVFIITRHHSKKNFEIKFSSEPFNEENERVKEREIFKPAGCDDGDEKKFWHSLK